MDWIVFGILIAKILIVFGFVLVGVIYQTWGERKVIGHMQLRPGPQFVGPFGLLQPLADGIKLLTKEDIIPTKADKWVFIIAPIIGVATAFAAWVVIPFGPHLVIFGQDISLAISNLNVGVLYVLALTSLGVYAIVLAGWASNSKYALLGGLRSSAQIISYELAMGLAIVVALIMSGSLNLTEIVNAQKGNWFIFSIPGFIAFIIFVIAMIAETNRAPFDLPEAETELVAGFHTEYSGFRFAMFFMAEYANMLLVSAMATILFLGGWNLPGLTVTNPLVGVLIFLAKVFFFIFLFFWLRATMPRIRYDRLMAFGWKILIPLSLANILLAALFVVAFK